MNILIAGGTGFVGTCLSNALIEDGHHVFILTRSPHKYTSDTKRIYIGYHDDLANLPPIYGVVNLAGTSLFGYWTKAKKAAILQSRIETTEHLIQMIQHMPTRPKVFINGSAVGFYGTSNDKMFTEKTTQPGTDFLAHVVTEWEQRAKQAEQLGIRTVYTRFGVILDKNHGALPLMSLPVKMFVGGQIGKGEQWISWVHIKDVVQVLRFCLDNEDVSGPINVTAPNPVRHKDFTKTLAGVLKRPSWLPVPAMFLKVALGDMSRLVTHGQYVLPQKAQTFHYKFTFTKIEDALRHIFMK